MHVYEKGGIGAMRVDKNKPFVLGHESSATIVKVGSEVTHLKVGDRVALEPAVPCCNCQWCLKGMYNLCDYCNAKARGLPPNDGVLQRYTVHPANFCFKLPENVSLEEGALAEPISCSLYGVQRAGVKVGDNVLIIGGGPIGLFSLVCAKAYGAQKICIAGKHEEGLKIAKELGADNTVFVHVDDPPEKLAAEIEKVAGKADVTLECTGTQKGIHAAILASKFGAKVALVGIGPELITIPVNELLYRQVDLLGVNKFVNNMELVLHLIETGKINVKPIITHKFLLEDWASAFDTVRGKKGSKILIEL
ncbi:sorbitol dehydrogenase-like protein [Leptotrombidium deliense]|uniref:Sorbitol dehydrogenase n=1 Tax=Leptotrombidium deliense TaxID=299467 RepID=A0A443S482_9ACAR|nr:sorbitol dehydrogenase-like protein [Leptotrombidium deliense]